MPRDKANKDRDEEREARIQQLMERARKALRRPEGQGTTKPKPQKPRKARKKTK